MAHHIHICMCKKNIYICIYITDYSSLLDGTGGHPPFWGDEVYSGSLHCGDRNLVISISLQQEAWLVALKLLCRMISGPILGALCDYHGRALFLEHQFACFFLGGLVASCWSTNMDKSANRLLTDWIQRKTDDFFNSRAFRKNCPSSILSIISWI